MMKHFSYIIFTLNLTLFTCTVYAQSPRFDSFKILKNKKSVEVTAIFQDHKGYIWLGTNYGLVNYDGVDFHLYTEKDSLYDIHIVITSYSIHYTKLYDFLKKKNACCNHNNDQEKKRQRDHSP